MPLWGNTDSAANSVKYGTELVRSGPAGSGDAAKAANNTSLYANVTPGAFKPDAVVGQFAVTRQEKANTSGPEKDYPQHIGWNMRFAGTGPVLTFSATGGTGFANGETVLVSGGSLNATGVVTANATGNLASVAVRTGGAGWANVAGTTVAINRDKRVTSITVGGTPLGYNNTDVITVSNGTINAIASVSTNATGGFVTANVTVSNAGLFVQSLLAANLVITVANSTGGATGGSGATFTPVLANSSGGTVAVLTLGGRAGRIQYETIVAMGSISSTGNTIPANT